MRYALDVPNSGDFFHPRLLAELAYEGEQSGWDGFFIWDHMTMFVPERAAREKGDDMVTGPIVDPWIALAAIATRTERIRIGTMVTPVPRRRPWKLARETVSLDHLSNGRLILGVGLGHPPGAEYERFGEEGAARVRAAKLDEGLEVLTGLWSGRPFSFEGEHFRLEETTFLPTPVQTPRIPVWVGGTWPHKGAFRRAARWDGVYPIRDDEEGVSPNDLRAIAAYVKKHRVVDDPFELVASAGDSGADPVSAAESVAAYAEVGATWWVLGLHSSYPTLDDVRARIRQGPPRV